MEGDHGDDDRSPKDGHGGLQGVLRPAGEVADKAQQGQKQLGKYY